MKFKDTWKIGKLVHIDKSAEFSCENIDIGDGCFIAHRAIIEGQSFKMGKNGFIGFEAYIDGRHGITCGDNVCIGPRAMIYTHAHWNSILDGYYCAHEPVVLEDDVWIGARAIIMPSVTIGKGSVVTVNSVVMHSLPSHVLATGNPVEIVIKDYPKKPTLNRRRQIIKQLCDDLRVFHIEYIPETDSLCYHHFDYPSEYTFFDLTNKKIQGKQNNITDEIREVLRKRGIKFEGLWRYKARKENP